MQISYQLLPFVSLAPLPINKHTLCEKASRYYAVLSELHQPANRERVIRGKVFPKHAVTIG